MRYLLRSSRLVELARRWLPRGMANLAAASLASQAISLVAMPLVARAAGIHALGLFQAYLTVLTFASVVVSLRFEYALLQPHSDDTALQLAWLGGLASLGCGCLALGLLPLARVAFKTAAWSELSSWALVVGLAIAVTGAAAVATQWLVRSGNFHAISTARLIQALVTAGGQLTAAFAGWGGVGLILGEALGRLAGLLTLLYSSRPSAAAAKADLSILALRQTFRTFRRFPLVSAPSSIINAAGFSLPAFLVERYYGVSALGMYSLIERVMGLPSTLIAVPLSQTFAHRLKQLERASVLPAKEIRSTVRLTLLLGLPFFGIIAIGGAPLFALVFGENWRRTGAIAQWLTLPYLMAYAVWPVMVTLTILNRLKTQLLWEAGRLCAMLGLLAVAAIYLPPLEAMLASTVGIMAIFGLLHYRLSLAAGHQRL